MHERTWQFRLADENVIDCASYFDKRATEVAAALNCQVVSSNVVRIESLRGNVRKVVGTALLQNIIEFPKYRKRLR
jgi:hypothetical protein